MKRASKGTTTRRLVCAVCALITGAGCNREAIQDEPELNALTKSEMTSYESTVNVWRDEQPGDEPSLHTSIRLTPRDGEKMWEDVTLDTIRIRSGDQEWTPNSSGIERSPEGELEIRADGAASLQAGSKVSVFVRLDTADGPKKIEISESVIEAIQ